MRLLLAEQPEQEPNSSMIINLRFLDQPPPHEATLHSLYCLFEMSTFDAAEPSPNTNFVKSPNKSTKCKIGSEVHHICMLSALSQLLWKLSLFLKEEKCFSLRSVTAF